MACEDILLIFLRYRNTPFKAGMHAASSQCSSRVTSNFGWELPLSTLTTLSGLVVPSPSAAARDSPVLSSASPGSGHYLPESVPADRATVCLVKNKSSLFVLPALFHIHDCQVLLGSGASENFISSSFVFPSVSRDPAPSPTVHRPSRKWLTPYSEHLRACPSPFRRSAIAPRTSCCEFFSPCSFGTSLLTKTQFHY